jgi:hypothetical protein
MSIRALIALVAALTGLFACGGGGAAPPTEAANAPATTPATASRTSEARLVTLIGERDLPGLHWIIIGDGFTADQQDDLRFAALELAAAMMAAPELASHSTVWNVHLLAVESRDSGVDDPASGKLVDTPFDGALGCGSNSRVACVDWDAIYSTLLSQGAPAAQLAVILNTPEYVGSSNSSGLIVSRHLHAPAVTLHEMGHRVAGLADEYIDAVVANEWSEFYFEGRFPNVTTATSAAHSPWRHWLEDSANGVGLYEGAFYAATGFYRAKHDSFMRTLGAPIGEVNTEAWLRAQYRVLPPISSVLPAAASLRGLSGEQLEFSIVSAWSDQVIDVRWFVDGVEHEAARGARAFHLAADGGTHEVRVVARDASGRIRAPDAAEAGSSHGWAISPSAPAAGKADTAQGVGRWLLMRVDATGHTLVSQTAAGGSRIAATGVTGSPADWQYALLDDTGAAVVSGQIEDPRRVTTAMSAPGEPHAGHGSGLLESGHYLIGVPRGVSVQKLRIAATAAGNSKLGLAGAAPAAIEIPLDPP